MSIAPYLYYMVVWGDPAIFSLKTILNVINYIFAPLVSRFLFTMRLLLVFLLLGIKVLSPLLQCQVHVSTSRL